MCTLTLRASECLVLSCSFARTVSCQVPVLSGFVLHKVTDESWRFITDLLQLATLKKSTRKSRKCEFVEERSRERLSSLVQLQYHPLHSSIEHGEVIAGTRLSTRESRTESLFVTISLNIPYHNQQMLFRSYSYIQPRHWAVISTVLGPLLFLIYINDLPDCVCSRCSLFADDCLICRRINNKFDQDMLQQDLQNLEVWAGKWLMTFNLNKCEVRTSDIIKKYSRAFIYIV